MVGLREKMGLSQDNASMYFFKGVEVGSLTHSISGKRKLHYFYKFKHIHNLRSQHSIVDKLIFMI